MKIKAHTLIKFISFIATCLISMIGTKTAYAGPGWDYKSSHGLTSCEFEVDQAALASVNGSVVSTGSRSVVINAEAGRLIDVKLYCARAQSFDNNGQLSSIGPEVQYSGPDGREGLVVGVNKPDDSVTNGYRRPKGRQWALAVGYSPATYTLTGGSDTLSITVQPVVGPVSQEQLKPVVDRAEQAYEVATHGGYKNRVFQFSGGYILHLNSIGRSADARGQRPAASQGAGLELDVMLGNPSAVKFLTGLTMDWVSAQKHVAYAPGQAANGFNSWVDWQRYFVGPKAGVDYMPASWFQLQAWASLGALVSVDGTIPVSQLPDRTLYSGESATKAALGYKAMIAPNFIIADHLVLGLNLGLEGNISSLPTERGPERVCTGTDCLVQREGNFANILAMARIGAQF